MKAQLLIAAAVSVLATSAGTANGIPFATPTATVSDTFTATPPASATATPTNTVAIADTPTQTAVPATGTPTPTSAATATLSPTPSPVASPTIAVSSATTVKSGKSNSSDRLVAYLVSASATLSGPSDTTTVYQTPPGRDFALTQICVSPLAEGGILVSAANLGPVAQLGGAVHSCQSFNPGFVLPPNAAVTCSTFENASPGAYFCMISGLLAPR